jgi:hypothetical protein
VAERIPFAEAISSPLLLKKTFDSMSLPQQVALKTFYGLPLKGEELRCWAVFQEKAIFDHLGYPVAVEEHPYIPKEYYQAWGLWGRRSGKTDKFLATIFAYEAALGGHESYIRKGQQAVCFLVSQNLAVARENMPLVLATLEESPLLSKEVRDKNADFIFLKNKIAIGMAPPSPKALRGYAIPVIGMDEVGMWYTDSESANPDYEVERSVRYAQIQFPHRKRLGISTPWIKDGLLWRYYNAGTEGIKLKDPAKRKSFRGILVLHSPTAAIGNPLITRSRLQEEYDEDPLAFDRESNAKFVDSLSGFLNAKLIRDAIDDGIYEREPLPRKDHPTDPTPIYIAALDPAFRRDAFGFCIAHNTGDGVVVDVVRRWKAPHGTVLNPSAVLDEIAVLLKQYRIYVCYSDQYHLESLQQLALDRNFSIEGVPFTAKSKGSIFGNLATLLNGKRLKLLDSEPGTHVGEAAREMVNELLTLERKMTQGGSVQISAPSGKHDDMASVLALCAFKAVWMMPVEAKPVPKEPTVFERCMANIRTKKILAGREQGTEWD